MRCNFSFTFFLVCSVPADELVISLLINKLLMFFVARFASLECRSELILNAG